MRDKRNPPDQRGSQLLHTYAIFRLNTLPIKLGFSPAWHSWTILELKERQAILQKHLAHLERQLAYLHNLQQLADQAGAAVDAQLRVLVFPLRRLRDEHRWIGAWLEEMQANARTSSTVNR